MECYLYDLAEDLYEKRNLISDPAYARIRSELAARMKEQMKKAGEPSSIIRPMEREDYLARIEKA